jgi:hypothetical protein
MSTKHRTRITRVAFGTLTNGAVVAVALGLVSGSVGAQAIPATAEARGQEAHALPFSVGERLTYRVRLARFGGKGAAEFRVDGPVDVRGTPTYLLRSTVETSVGLVKVVNRSESWLDPRRMASHRFRKRERTLASSHSETVEMFPASRRWESGDGGSGETLSDAPLDELSFIYFLRTVPLAADSTYRFDRHFDASRNPTTVRVLGRETVTTAAGTFATVAIEMRVMDAGRYHGEGVIRINLTDDHCRIPVRIQSTVPVAGAAVLTLESRTPAAGQVAVVVP